MNRYKKQIIIVFLLIFTLTPLGKVHAETKPDVDTCRQAWAPRMDKIDKEWLDSVNRLMHQKSASSSLSAYVISDFRTYWCNLRAVCKDVSASFNQTKGTKSNQIHNIIGCFTVEEPRKLEIIDECTTNVAEIHETLRLECNNHIVEKKNIAKVFIKAMMHKDAYHKKTAFLVYRYQLLLGKVHNLMQEHLRLMFGYLSEFISRTKCYLEQCDRGAGQEMQLGK